MCAKTNIFLFVFLIASCIATSPLSSEKEIEEVVPVAENFQDDKPKELVGCIETKWGCFDPADVAILPRLEVDDENKGQNDEEVSFGRHCQCIVVPGVGCVYPCDSPLRP